MESSGSPSVWAGATTMESPVWMPTGSTFSMEQMVMAQPEASRMASNSISFQPAMQRSMSTCPTREWRRPFSAISTSCSGVSAMPPPVPPSV